ncbi:LuxR family transcriptional regulator [Oceanibaculum indicum]|uniref:LuxR family transcriptional regulator n=1 Tax=Oceanibaculum indicum TaxID=526216 RepID=A0A420WH08_9PROT|nr:LuxR family transcriptional regulator [Oceanibaculum indicum]RKQ70256.1 LuxR family transcriptional regulator [Oceanibaculum indicum]
MAGRKGRRMDHLLQQRLIDLHGLSEAGEFKAHLQDIARTMGFARIFYVSARLVPASLPGPGGFAEIPLILCDYPEDWVSHYQGRQLARIDPVIAACNATRRPLSWDVRGFAPEADEPVRRLLDDAIDAGIDRGISVPIYGVGGEYGMVTFVADRAEPARPLDDTGLLSDCTLVANHFHMTLRQRIGNDPAQIEALRLTARELEVMKWAAAGKTREEIADILKVTPHTVKFHIYNTHAKLDVFSTPHAIAKLVYLGLLEPPGLSGSRGYRMV